jgi:hypothetical protein
MLRSRLLEPAELSRLREGARAEPARAERARDRGRWRRRLRPLLRGLPQLDAHRPVRGSHPRLSPGRGRHAADGLSHGSATAGTDTRAPQLPDRPLLAQLMFDEIFRMRRRGLEPPPGYPGPGPQPGNPGVRYVLCVHIVQNVQESGRIGRDGRSGCCRGCCHEPLASRQRDAERPAPAWMDYVKVRRRLISLEDSIDRGVQWVVFEPNALPAPARATCAPRSPPPRARRRAALTYVIAAIRQVA